MQNNIDKLLQKGLRKQYLSSPTRKDLQLGRVESNILRPSSPIMASNWWLSMKVTVGMKNETYIFYPTKHIEELNVPNIANTIKHFNSTKELSHLEYIDTLLQLSGSLYKSKNYYVQKWNRLIKRAKQDQFTSAIRYGVLTDKGLLYLKQTRDTWVTSIINLTQAIEQLRRAEEALNILKGANRGSEIGDLELSLYRLKSELNRVDALISFNERRK